MKYPLLAALCCCAMLVCTANAQPNYKAVSLTVWGGGDGTADEHPLTMDNLRLDQLSQSLDNMQAIGVDTVGVNVFWLQDNINSQLISPDPTGASGFAGTATTEVTTTVIDAIHDRGMKVMLKPLVNLRNDPSHWRGQIPGSDSWFWGSGQAVHDGTHAGAADDPYDGYANYIYHWAEIAQAHNVEIFAIGTELASASGGPTNEARWRAAIGSDGGDGVGGSGSGIRNRYDGLLTYAAQPAWSPSPPATTATAADIRWWDEMDFLGVDAYYPLTDYYGNNDDPSLETLIAAWEGHADMLADWSAAHGLDVLLTEVGYTSSDGTTRHPWELPGSSPEDQAEQAAAYQALLTALWDEPFFEGAFWWNWEIDPDPSDWDHAPTWFTPQGKLAEDVLADYYVPEPSSLLLMAFGAWVIRRNRRTAG
ncbi:MAG: glycoside hydrolase family 113 [Phycisphaerae bacterium]